MEIVVLNGKTYEIVKLLGKGKRGYSYLAICEGKQFVLKNIHHEPCEYYNFGDKFEAEMNDYNRLRQVGIRIPDMIDSDKESEYIIKEYVDGPTAYDLVLEDEMRDEYIEQIKVMCDLLYSAGLNIDYFPTNFILCDGLMWYIDYECNNYMDEWTFENWGIKYWSKTPEFCEYHNKNRRV